MAKHRNISTSYAFRYAHERFCTPGNLERLDAYDISRMMKAFGFRLKAKTI